ncbi:hypothetical protein B0T25DRAFT_207941 [Lasiosphaeria hispida]|uniref:Uncharacterized protein n=1 Tax=Lasiosphaeria hispida TaxID=260671 RepID=A0AAJ0HJ37_9PEZI|nr:hypothetical protein B0T25DRAFT_207941 [Lasiosphaeria hispida]
MPTAEDLLRFGLSLCLDCIGVVWLMGFVTVELPHTDKVTFATRLCNTRQTYDNSPCEILYNNGLVTLEELARKKRPTPKPSVTERVKDNTDYAEQQGLLRPGCMISSIKGDSTTSKATGIIVERNGEQRLTFSRRLWEELANTNKTVILGDDTPASRKLFRATRGTRGRLSDMWWNGLERRYCLDETGRWRQVPKRFR